MLVIRNICNRTSDKFLPLTPVAMDENGMAIVHDGLDVQNPESSGILPLSRPLGRALHRSSFK